jgi:uracil-DNA glycosylase
MDFSNIPIDVNWFKMFEYINRNNKFTEALDKIKEQCLNDKSLYIFPKPQLLLSTFLLTGPDNIKVVILGQDPYFNKITTSGRKVYPNMYEKSSDQHTQAMGMSFSVPNKAPVPPSLNNIYDNLIKYGHMTDKPKHGNLSLWGVQGCLMLNAFLTVEAGKPKTHKNIWENITEDMIKYLSNNFEDLVFVLWGGPALKKMEWIDVNKHDIIVSSHPSPLSYTNTLGKGRYPAFRDNDHFGQINECLIDKGKEPILWNIL